MVALKTSEADAFVARPDSSRAVVLVFGPDAGLVSERVDALVKASVDDTNDPFALVRLDGDTLASDPARLVDAATTLPLFGGGEAWRGVRLSGGRGGSEAGHLKRGAALRNLVERARNAVAIPCYADAARD